MADSTITCSGLTAASGVGQVTLTWAVADPNARGLPYLALDAVEVWAAPANDRTAAARIGEGASAFVHAGVPEGAARFYWIRARNRSGFFGDWFPAGAAAGVRGVAGSATPGPQSITQTMLAPKAVAPANLDVPKLADITTALGVMETGTLKANVAYLGNVYAGQILANSLSAISANLGFVTAGTMSANVAYLGSIEAEQVNASSLSAISANLGSVTAGSITGVTIDGVTITGGTVRTSPFVARFEMSSATNSLRGFDIFGSPIFEAQANPNAGPVLTLGQTTSNATANIGNFGSGYGLAVFGGSQAAVNAQNNSAGATGTIQAGNLSSGRAFYSLAGGYGPFTGSHDGLWPVDEPLPEIGDVLCDRRILARRGISDAISELALAAAPGDRTVIGVFAGIADLDGEPAAAPAALRGASRDRLRRLARRYRLAVVNALGEGLINVTDAAGPIAAGDLLEASAVPGKAQRQADDVVRASTVARAREGSRGSARIACIYLAG